MCNKICQEKNEKKYGGLSHRVAPQSAVCKNGLKNTPTETVKCSICV